jgi:hypothetical protein
MSQNTEEHRIHNKENSQLQVSKPCVKTRESINTVLARRFRNRTRFGTVYGTNVVGENTAPFFRA